MNFESNISKVILLEPLKTFHRATKLQAKSFIRAAASVALVGLTGSFSSASFAKTPAVTAEQATLTSALGVSDALAAIDKSRSPIVKRIVSDYSSAAAANGIGAADLRALLMSLRADELLAATLVNDIDGLIALLKNPAQDASNALRYQPVAPAKVTEFTLPTQAQAVLIQQGEAVNVSTLASFNSELSNHSAVGTLVLGYFEAPTTNTLTTVIDRISGDIAKDGVGSGANSWIGNTAGGNIANSQGSAVAAGTSNAALAQGAFVGSGTANQAAGISSLVIGGFDNRATAIDAMVGSGAGNRATGARSIVVGGGYNLASGNSSFIGGGGRIGTANTAAGTNGLDNIAAGEYSVVVGGAANSASGRYASILGGNGNTAAANLSLAMGSDANANQTNCAVFAFWITPTKLPCLPGANSMTFGASLGFSFEFETQRADGGGTSWVYIGKNFTGQHIATSTRAYLSSGGIWTNNSDRASKENFQAINGRDVLAKLVSLPITTWNYLKEGKTVRRIGPMAQDFHAAFKLGQNDTSIGGLDATGVALAAIQGLNQKLVVESKAKDAKLLSQQNEIAAMKSQLAAIKKKLGL